MQPQTEPQFVANSPLPTLPFTPQFQQKLMLMLMQRKLEQKVKKLQFAVSSLQPTLHYLVPWSQQSRLFSPMSIKMKQTQTLRSWSKDKESTHCFPAHLLTSILLKKLLTLTNLLILILFQSRSLKETGWMYSKETTRLKVRLLRQNKTQKIMQIH